VPPARPYWKGYLKLALVSCPIALYSAASSSERVAFRQINKKTGNRLRQQLVDEVTREPVESQDKGRGYEYAKNAYIQVEDEELDAIAVESNHTIEIDKFVPRDQIDERYLDSPYYLLPNDQVGQEAFAVIREAMRGKKMVALGRVVLAKRERIIMLQPWGKGLMGATLRYGYEVRDQKEFFDDLPGRSMMMMSYRRIFGSSRRSATDRKFCSTDSGARRRWHGRQASRYLSGFAERYGHKQRRLCHLTTSPLPT
jgi:DNA end-binding protein Ku